jgi:hypothetical protein
MANKTTRLSLGMNGQQVVIAMAGGNPGALNVCVRILKEGGVIDPDDAFGGLGTILALDALGIHEERIWLLYKDVCRQDLAKMIAVLRARQLGQLAGATEAAINHAMDHGGQGLDLDKILDAVQAKFPRFNGGQKALAA